VAEFIIWLVVAVAVLIIPHQAEQEVLEAEVQEEIKPLTLPVELLIRAAVAAHLGV